MEAKRLFDEVFKVGGKLATRSLYPGTKVYGEEIIKDGDVEYRMWNPYRSKLAAAIMNGLKGMHIKNGSSVLYLGASTGTTTSHVSDIVGKKGTVYCIEISERSMRDLLKVCAVRENMLPILKDARDVDSYAEDVGTADVVYMDVSAKDQDGILIKNARLLKKGGYAYAAIKSQSIDVTKAPRDVFNEFLESVSNEFLILEKIDIEPYDKMHLFVVLKKRT